ncbi:hypothetical protein F5X97DRAFT_328570 [Nemania serpens]|nr:hypothetical protein F5X97DRAFT_328570 [Nemania serpens]
MSSVHRKDIQTRFDYCPRKLTVRALEQLEKECGAHWTGYSRRVGLRARTLDLFEEIIDALERSSVKTHHFHVEPGDQLWPRNRTLAGPSNGLYVHLSRSQQGWVPASSITWSRSVSSEWQIMTATAAPRAIARVHGLVSVLITVTSPT